MKQTFTSEVLDQDLLEIAINIQVNSIMDSPEAHRGRSRASVYNSTKQGIIAEQYLIQKCGFKEDTYKYGDLIKDNIKYEIKAFSNPTRDIPPMLFKLKGWRAKGWYHCQQMIVYKVTNGTYSFFGEYEI